MEKHSISVLGADKKQYEIADFRARGMNYTNAIGIIVTTEFMSRILAFAISWKKVQRRYLPLPAPVITGISQEE